jgi:hypothetical protein
LAALGVSVYFVVKAVFASLRSPQNHLLFAIYFILMGHFAIAVHNYLARAARSLESAEEIDGENRQ